MAETPGAAYVVGVRYEVENDEGRTDRTISPADRMTAAEWAAQAAEWAAQAAEWAAQAAERARRDGLFDAGCLPNSDPIGPFETVAKALADARGVPA